MKEDYFHEMMHRVAAQLGHVAARKEDGVWVADREDPFPESYALPNWAGDLGAAWDLVVAMQKMGVAVNVGVNPRSYCSGAYAFVSATYDDVSLHETFLMDGKEPDQLSLAICRAFLSVSAALGEEVTGGVS